MTLLYLLIYSCTGGNPLNALPYGVTKGFAPTSAYKSYDNTKSSCGSASSTVKVPNFCYIMGDMGSNDNILLAIMAKYDTAAAVILEASNSFMSYRRGIYDDETCGKKLSQATHAVTRKYAPWSMCLGIL